MTNEFVDNDGWEVTGASEVVTDCGGTKLFGGFEKFVKGVSTTRTFNDIPDHKRIKISMELWKIDNWDG